MLGLLTLGWYDRPFTGKMSTSKIRSIIMASAQSMDGRYPGLPAGDRWDL